MLDIGKFPIWRVDKFLTCSTKMANIVVVSLVHVMGMADFPWYYFYNFHYLTEAERLLSFIWSVPSLDSAGVLWAATSACGGKLKHSSSDEYSSMFWHRFSLCDSPVQSEIQIIKTNPSTWQEFILVLPDLLMPMWLGPIFLVNLTLYLLICALWH